MLSLSVLGCNIRVEHQDTKVRSLLMANYGYMQGESDEVCLHYSIRRQEGEPSFVIKRDGHDPMMASDHGEFLFLFEKDMTIELQKLRKDLYFVHAAALEWGGRALMLVARSGSGKSTTTWALLHHGFRYLSDELAPVDLKTLHVYPYPHALCLKDEPPETYPLPKSTIYTSQTMHVPVNALPSGIGSSPTPLGTIFFLTRNPRVSEPAVRPISSAEAGARLFANALNALAHRGDGLDGAIEIATKVACFELTIGDLPSACALVKASLEARSRV